MGLQRLFHPQSIAVVGASANRSKIGGSIYFNLKKYKFPGTVYPINNKRRLIGPARCYASVRDIASKIDVAIIAVPRSAVESVLIDCGQKKIPFVVIITAGYSETGNRGRSYEDRLKKIARKYNVRVLGPNCLGFINTPHAINASFSSGFPKSGGVSFVSQSGAMMVGLIDWSLDKNVGLSTLVSIGNEAGIRDIEVLDYLAHDPSTT